MSMRVPKESELPVAHRWMIRVWVEIRKTPPNTETQGNILALQNQSGNHMRTGSLMRCLARPCFQERPEIISEDHQCAFGEEEAV